MKKLITICAVIGLLLIVSANVKGAMDPCLLLHFDGTDGQTTTVDSSTHNHSPITFFGNAHLDTTVKYAGSASLSLDGDGDYLTIPDSPDWDILASSTDNWTIDFYVKHNNTAGYQRYLSQGIDWYMSYEGGLGFQGSGINLPHAGPISDSDWHWIAFCKVDANYAIYKDGTQVNYLHDTTTTGTSTYGLTIGGHFTGEMHFVNGYMDELRITHDNLFDASPNADYLTNPDTIDYVPSNNGIPEPMTIVLLGFGSLTLLRRKRRAKLN